MESNNVILDFSRIDFSDAHICDEHNLIHRKRMESFQRIASSQIEMAKEEFGLWCQNKGKVRNVHNAISIFANRGAGKTTFLLSAIEWLRNKYAETLCLKPIDPSMIGEKENAFVNIIAEIHEHVIAKMESYNYDCRDSEDLRDQQRRIDTCFTQLMEAMSFMEGIGRNGKYEDWDDAEFAAKKGIEKAISSNNIDKLFQEYIYYALKLLGKECVVISFDDIDTDFNKGYEILEIIRRFLTSPMIMTILTGDLELYGKLVRKASWKCFNKEFLEKEKDYAHRKEQEFSTMIDQLENQYLIKILKPEYRIPISTIKEYLADKDFEINVRFKKDDPENGYPISDCYDRLLKEIGGSQPGSKLSEELKQFLLGLSLRIQIRLLSSIKNQDLMRLTRTRYNKESLAVGIQAVFWNDINQKADNGKLLIKSSPVYTAEMLKFLEYTNSISVGSPFLPQTEDEILNKALFAIGAKYNQLVGSYQHLVFDYWCRISYTGTFYRRLSKGDRLFSDFLDYALLKTDSGLVKSVGMTQAYSASMPMVADDPIIGVDMLPEIPFFFSDAHSILSMLPTYGTIDGNRNEKAYFSIYKLMALISDMMRFCHDAKGDPEEKISRVMAQLSKLGQYRTFAIPTPTLNNERNERIKDETNENYHFLFNTEFIEKEEQIVKLVNEFIKWEEEKIEISCQSLHHIFVRFYYTMTHIAGNITVADRFNKYVLSLLNATLVEAAIDNGFSSFNMSNLGDIENIFMDNVRVMKYRVKNDRKANSAFAFYNWLSTCPLLLIFIDPAVFSYIRNRKLTIEDMNSWSKYHVRNKSLKYCIKYVNHYDKEKRKLDSMREQVSNMIEYNLLRTDVERDEFYFRRSLDSESYSRLKDSTENKRQRMKELSAKTTPTVSFHGESVTLGSDYSSLENMQNALVRESYSNSRVLVSHEKRKAQFENALSQLGLIDEFRLLEDEAYNSLNRNVLSVYNIIENMYPLYRNDDE